MIEKLKDYVEQEMHEAARICITSELHSKSATHHAVRFAALRDIRDFIMEMENEQENRS